MALSNKQLTLMRFPYMGYRALIADGAVRSGKTHPESVSFILWAMNNFKGRFLGVASKTIGTCFRNVINPLLNTKYLLDRFDMKYTISNSTLIISNKEVTNTFYVFGGNDEASYALVQGATFAGIFLDEVALMPRSFVEMMVSRCSVEGALLWFNCNPQGPKHWFKLEWIDKAEEKNALYIHFDMRDNPSLSQETLDMYEKMFTGVFYERYIKGRWVLAEGLIYRKFADAPEKYALKKVPEDILFLSTGVDFGGNKSATTFSCWGIGRGFKYIVCLESERHVEEIDPQELDRLYVKFCNTVFEKYGKPFESRADNAEPVLMRGIKNAAARAQCRVAVRPAQKRPVNERIDLFVKLIGQGRLFYMEWCTNLRDALSTAVWDEKHPDERLDNGTTDIDTLDCSEYAIEPYTNELLAAGGLAEWTLTKL